MQRKPKRRGPGVGKRGPLPFRPKAAQRKLVTLFAAGGMSEPGIAREIGICQNTLRKHFAEDLRAGHEHELAVNLKRLQKAADAGNVTAMKHLDAKFSIVAAAASFEAPPERPRAAAKIGKKAQAQAEAEAVVAGGGADWGDDLQLGSKLPN